MELNFQTIIDPSNSKRRKLNPTSAGVNVAPPFLAGNLSDVKKVSRCFSEKEFCVLNGTESLTKQELERKIASGGGSIVQHPGKKKKLC